LWGSQNEVAFSIPIMDLRVEKIYTIKCCVYLKHAHKCFERSKTYSNQKEP
jgi:hypothetical protein